MTSRKSRQRKAQGLSLNVVIIAAIGIIVLAILIFLVYGKTGDFGRGVEEIGSSDTCKGSSTEGSKTYYYAKCDYSCPSNTVQEYSRSIGGAGNIDKVCCRAESQGLLTGCSG